MQPEAMTLRTLLKVEGCALERFKEQAHDNDYENRLQLLLSRSEFHYNFATSFKNDELIILSQNLDMISKKIKEYISDKEKIHPFITEPS